MRAARFHEYGEPDVLTIEEAPEPHAGAGQVRIRVAAASVNPIDVKIRAGYLAEAMPTAFPAITGSDAAGVGDEVGPEVSGVAVGDAVFGLTRDAAAEYAVLYAWAPTPANWTVEESAAAGLASATASAALDALGELSGRTILIEGAAGGVGSAAVEIALARGARVVGTASESHHDFLRELGAVPVTYGPGLADRVAEVAPEGISGALDLVGSGSLADLVAIVGDPGSVATIADYTAAALGVPLVQGTSNAAANLALASRLGTEGSYRPRVEAVHPVDQIAEAHRHVQAGHTEGKVVVRL